MRAIVILGAALATAGLTLALGPVGFVAGLVLGGIAVGVSPLLAFAAGQVFLGAMGWGSLVALSVTELGLVAVLLGGDALALDARLVGVYAVAAGSLAGVVAVSLAVTDSLWVTTGVALAVVGLLSYGVHRYGVVVLWRLDIDRVAPMPSTRGGEQG